MRTLHHLALGANSVETVAAFYRDILGLRENTRHHYPDGTTRAIWLELSSHAVLMIEHTEQQRPLIDGIVPGLFLLTIGIEAVERDSLETRLQDAGHPIESRTDFTSYFRDPEGNRAAISYYPIAISKTEKSALKKTDQKQQEAHLRPQKTRTIVE